jgi:hypothetical protein
MKKLLTFILLIAGYRATAQDSLKLINAERSQVTITGMRVLGGWGFANIAAGAAGWAASKGGQNRYFYQMTTVWGVVNAAVAINGYANARNEHNENLTPAESLKAQQKIERIFLFNGALDVAYIGAGFYLDSRGSNNNNAQLKGYGTSIALQGAFLLLFDATMYRTQHGNGTRLRRFLEKTPITFTGKTVGIQLNI